MNWVKIFDPDEKLLGTLAWNKPQLLLVHGKRICLVRREDRWLAVEDTCPHNGESLSKGSVNFLAEIVCPWHGHRFNLKTGRECEQRSRDLVTYPVRLDADGLFIGL
jgi:nitrite reductase/ring-hydroxylating ferredoxin subunit